jgi:hypothetical protein
MLGCRDLAGRALDQRPQVFAGEPKNIDATTLGLRVELRSVGEASGRRVKEPEQAARRSVVEVRPSLVRHHAALVSPLQVTPILG